MDKPIVIFNRDHQRELKGSKEFQKQDERFLNISNIKCVEEVLLSLDNNRIQCETLKSLHAKLNDTYQIAFANGSD